MTGARVGWPSPKFPAFPAASVPLPAGWTPFVQGGAVFGAHHVVGSGGFNANVLITVERWPIAATAEQSLEVLRARIGQVKGREQRVETGLTEPDGVYLEAVQREPRLGELLVVYRTAVVPHDGITDVLTAVGTASVLQVKAIGDDLRAMVRGLELMPPDEAERDA
ncbi:hypothetical protein GCM10011490_24980 [Pseudoclavibacter endophyticus]|uniref:DUF1795 domain-containing protein n=1 Tax=Pseudoclavibacter endophyticus TaxID=1778590 RepID=A0A6H9WJK7_9MICO|nr:hypothetical protein [Pseudoclavibacter endophyticus]KAB1647829.1 hypothetical protein F8O04_12475 [Pseudoclavibacter endophyticus]GGA73156.1 hypothetical protein GCM10011490_24980 [Pseudoclavibacter endophyticus]